MLEDRDRQLLGPSTPVVAPKRWIVERTFAWICGNFRLAHRFERYTASMIAFVRLAMLRLMLKCLTGPDLCS